jgi:hypothetical protein
VAHPDFICHGYQSGFPFFVAAIERVWIRYSLFVQQCFVPMGQGGGDLFHSVHPLPIVVVLQLGVQRPD